MWARQTLNIPPRTISKGFLRKHYREILILIHPDKNDTIFKPHCEQAFRSAEYAFKLLRPLAVEDRPLFDPPKATTGLHPDLLGRTIVERGGLKPTTRGPQHRRRPLPTPTVSNDIGDLEWVADRATSSLREVAAEGVPAQGRVTDSVALVSAYVGLLLSGVSPRRVWIVELSLVALWSSGNGRDQFCLPRDPTVEHIFFVITDVGTPDLGDTASTRGNTQPEGKHFSLLWGRKATETWHWCHIDCVPQLGHELITPVDS